MLTLILSYIGGVLTILSPCVLPVIPFIFARSDQPFRKSGLPMLIGMGLSFTSFAALSVAGGRWVIQANQIGRSLALVVFALLGLSLIFSKVAERIALPFVRIGDALQKRASAKSGLFSSLLLGASIGLLWAPCAGPILGLVLAGAAFGSSGQKTFALLLAFAAGAATSLSVAIFAGSKAIKFLKKGFGAEEWIRRLLGVMVLGGVVAISLGLDTKLLSQLSFINTGELEQALIDRVTSKPKTLDKASILGDEGLSPPLDGATQWLNSEPLSIASLQGKVVLIDFWTYSCINCLRTLPYVKAWAEKYRDQGLVVIGVHSPEFAFEKSIDNVKNSVAELNIKYPVAVDSNQIIWSAFKNRYWPAHYFLDSKGHIRFHHFGEGNYAESEKLIQELLTEAHGTQSLAAAEAVTASMASKSTIEPINGTGVEAPSSGESIVSPETYLGYSRQTGFASVPTIQKNTLATYKIPSQLSLNQWGLAGSWKIASEMAKLSSSRGKLAFHFRARDLHLVMGAPEGKTISFRVTIDGKAPQNSHGHDNDANGDGSVKAHRLYQLIRQPLETEKTSGEHTFQIEFMEPGIEVFAFTFG